MADRIKPLIQPLPFTGIIKPCEPTALPLYTRHLSAQMGYTNKGFNKCSIMLGEEEIFAVTMSSPSNPYARLYELVAEHGLDVQRYKTIFSVFDEDLKNPGKPIYSPEDMFRLFTCWVYVDLIRAGRLNHQTYFQRTSQFAGDRVSYRLTVVTDSKEETVVTHELVAIRTFRGKYAPTNITVQATAYSSDYHDLFVPNEKRVCTLVLNYLFFTLVDSAISEVAFKRLGLIDNDE